MKLILIILSSITFNATLHSQVFCSEILPKVFFGPLNVISNHNNIQSIYQSELNKSITDLKQLMVANTDDKITTEIIQKEIEIITQILDTWSSYTHVNASQLENYTDDNSIIREFFTLEMLHPNRIVHVNYGKNDCLFADPNDCIIYRRLKSKHWDLIDDYGNKVDSNFHNFEDVKYNPGNKIFYVQRNIEESN